MIQSMTAFAREQEPGAEGDLVWELRTVNHRFLEVYVRGVRAVAKACLK